MFICRCRTCINVYTIQGQQGSTESLTTMQLDFVKIFLQTCDSKMTNTDNLSMNIMTFYSLDMTYNRIILQDQIPGSRILLTKFTCKVLSVTCDLARIQYLSSESIAQTIFIHIVRWLLTIYINYNIAQHYIRVFNISTYWS